MNYYKVFPKIILIFSALLCPKAGFSEPLRNPSIILENNEINDNHLSGVIVRGDQAVEIRNSRIRSNGEAGVEIDAAAGKDEIRDSFEPPLFRWINAEIKTPENSQKLRVNLNHCEIEANGRAGVDVRQGAAADISESKIHHNELSGIMASSDERSVFGPTSVSLADSSVWDNRHAGIRATPRATSTSASVPSEAEPSEAKISEAELSEAKPSEAELSEAKPSEAKLSEAELSEAKLSEAELSEAELSEAELSEAELSEAELSEAKPSEAEPLAEIYISNSRIHRNHNAGVLVENSTRLTIRDSELRENGSGLISRVWQVIPDRPTGKEIHDFEGLAEPGDYVSPLLDIYRNAISFNAGPGIHVIDGTTGSFGISNNQIYNNDQSGIYLGVADDPFSRRNLSVSIINNTITSNGSDQNGAGIRDESSGWVLTVNNILAYNYETGIRSEECKDASHNLLFANGLAGNCCSDETSDESKWAERFQRSGELEGCGDIIMDPLFVNPDKYDFRLKRHSPAIDAGSQESVYDDEKFLPSQGTKINDLGASGGPLASQ